MIFLILQWWLCSRIKLLAIKIKFDNSLFTKNTTLPKLPNYSKSALNTSYKIFYFYKDLPSLRAAGIRVSCASKSDVREAFIYFIGVLFKGESLRAAGIRVSCASKVTSERLSSISSEFYLKSNLSKKLGHFWNYYSFKTV